MPSRADSPGRVFKTLAPRVCGGDATATRAVDTLSLTACDGDATPSSRLAFRRSPRSGCLDRLRGFTLAEVLAALLFMSIVVPVALHGVSVASRAGILGQRKAAAARVADRVLEEMIVTGQLTAGAANGTQADGETNYAWTLETLPWSEDALSVATVKVSFDVQGQTYDISVSTLYDPAAVTPPPTSSLQ